VSGSFSEMQRLGVFMCRIGLIYATCQSRAYKELTSSLRSA